MSGEILVMVGYNKRLWWGRLVLAFLSGPIKDEGHFITVTSLGVPGPTNPHTRIKNPEQTTQNTEQTTFYLGLLSPSTLTYMAGPELHGNGCLCFQATLVSIYKCQQPTFATLVGGFIYL